MASSRSGLGSRIGIVDLTNFDFSTLTVTKEPDIPPADCNVCGDLNFRPLPTGDEYVSQPFQRDIEPQELTLAAKNGCEACHLLRNSVQQWLEDGAAPETEVLLDVKRLKLHTAFVHSTLVVWIEFKDDKETEYIELYTQKVRSFA